MTTPTLVLDCNFLGYTVRYTMGGLSHHDLATGVIFGFLSRVLTLAHKFQTSKIVFAWDSRKSHRRRIFDDYKKNRRDKTEEERAELEVMHTQFKLLRRKILPAIGFRNVLMQTGIEADDLIAKTVWHRDGMNFIIVASDQDLYQLLQFNNVRMYNPNKRKMMTKSRFEEEYGIRPEQWIKVKMIAGCPGDNVPGIKGVGEKTVIKYLRAELPHTKKWRDIVDGSNTDLYERNLKLVQLPFRSTQDVILSQDEFDVKEFQRVCKKYGMRSFLKPSRLLEWKQLFSGMWTGDKEPVTEVKHRRSRRSK